MPPRLQDRAAYLPCLPVLHHLVKRDATISGGVHRLWPTANRGSGQQGKIQSVDDGDNSTQGQQVALHTVHAIQHEPSLRTADQSCWAPAVSRTRGRGGGGRRAQLKFASLPRTRTHGPSSPHDGERHQTHTCHLKRCDTHVPPRAGPTGDHHKNGTQFNEAHCGPKNLHTCTPSGSTPIRHRHTPCQSDPAAD